MCFYENPAGALMGMALDLLVNLRRFGVFTALRLPVRENRFASLFIRSPLLCHQVLYVVELFTEDPNRALVKGIFQNFIVWCLGHEEVSKPGIEPAPHQQPKPLQWQCQTLKQLLNKRSLKCIFCLLIARL